MDLTRSTIHWGENTSQLIIKNCNRKDCGKYILTATNASGVSQKEVRVTVLGMRIIMDYNLSGELHEIRFLARVLL